MFIDWYNKLDKNLREGFILQYNCWLPTKVLFGPGRLNDLHKEIMPGKKALLLISNGKSTKTNGSLERTQNQLKLAGVDSVLFDKIQSNPLKKTVEDGAIFAKENNCDFIVALGGGSVLDSSKAIALLVSNPGDLWDYVSSGTGKNRPIKNKPLPIIAITTTAGTGSEVDCGGVITKPETREKSAIVHPFLFPEIAIVDPELMKTVPSKFTAFQGFDALLQATEGYIAKNHNLISEMFQRTVIENISKYLARAVKNGDDLEARTHMAFANVMSGYSMMTSSCTSEHSLEHALSAFHEELPHGAGLIMISKAYYLYFIEKNICHDRFIDMAKFFGNKNADSALDFIDELEKLKFDCGVNDLKMSDYGITPEEFDDLAKNARQTMDGVDPCDLSHEDCVNIYRRSYK